MPDGNASTGGTECSLSLIGICHITDSWELLQDRGAEIPLSRRWNWI